MKNAHCEMPIPQWLCHSHFAFGILRLRLTCSFRQR
jgi:hypothetical protein